MKAKEERKINRELYTKSSQESFTHVINNAIVSIFLINEKQLLHWCKQRTNKHYIKTNKKQFIV